jgi:rare lipoprotein A
MTFHNRLLTLLLLAGLTSCSAPRAAHTPTALQAAASKPSASGNKQYGIASVYTDHRTASGERFNGRALAAAHRTYPFGTKVRVTALKTGRSAIVRINDRGPYIRSRIIDLTPAAAAAIGLTKKMGITKVAIERLR